jgi:hypothetical protein
MKRLAALCANAYREHRLLMQIALAVFVAVATLDFLLRVGVFRDSQQRAVKVPRAETVRALLDREAVERRLLEVLPPAKPEGDGGAAAVQKKIELLAVFRSLAGATAVINLISPVAGEATVMKVVRAGDELEGWTVESINARQLVLARAQEQGEERQELVLFKGKEP